MKREQCVAKIKELCSVIVPNSVTLMKITGQISVIPIIRGENDRDQRNSGKIFPYFAINMSIRVNNILQFRYL
ncbi:MAG: hypothetical protein K0R28_464 [Paenibacillus sp.]|nr:hypothetical protein [Paenibacillus sp.]